MNKEENESKKVRNNDFEVGEDATKYGEFISSYFLFSYPTVYVLWGLAKDTIYDESIPLDRNEPTSTSAIKCLFTLSSITSLIFLTASVKLIVYSLKSNLKYLFILILYIK